jgi:hypothetical protein
VISLKRNTPVGVAKQRAVLSRLSVALELEETFHKPFPCYVRADAGVISHRNGEDRADRSVVLPQPRGKPRARGSPILSFRKPQVSYRPGSHPRPPLKSPGCAASA